MFGHFLDGWKKYLNAGCTKGSRVDAGIVKSLVYAVAPKKKVGNAITAAGSSKKKRRKREKQPDDQTVSGLFAFGGKIHNYVL